MFRRLFVAPTARDPPAPRPADRRRHRADDAEALRPRVAAAPELLGVAIGTFADPTFSPPMIAGFAAEGAAWAMNVSDLPMPGGRYDYDGTSHGGARA